MIRTFRCRNYKNLPAQSLELARVNVLIGPNNSGKSNFVEALSFLPDMWRLSPEDPHGIRSAYAKESRAGAAILHRGTPRDEPVELAWGFERGGVSYGYELDLQVGARDEDGPILQRERLWERGAIGERALVHRSDPGRRYEWTDATSGPMPLECRPSTDDSFLVAPPTFVEFGLGFDVEFLGRLASSIGAFATRSHRYHCASFQPREMARPTRGGKAASYLDGTGQPLPTVLSKLDLDTVTQWLQSYFLPELEGVRVIPVAGYTAVELAWAGRWRPLAEMSDGTVQLLARAALLACPERHGVLAIDEPELNLHPGWVKQLATDVFRSHAAETFVISTHSSEFLDAITPAFVQGDVAVLVFELDRGEPAQIRPLRPDTESLAALLDEGWRLGDLFRAHVPEVGGWPW